ncbi:hypothetical protein EI74_0592 [Mycoplasma testudineum]|uniref:Uncharacterized protein n=1 Tax=Mycoplasma testudineum TaxID=244584 RepID=A0A4R6IDY1_9MOLU|nr:hypothetical protein [Mycoplasma testudineum]OYD26659.1 hypothetical protein CG473_02560 [Mycoplasma testudineum]TDO19788.1 hypothetical protein EI74_0592 [Mycoplasma testudineum]
MKKLVKPSGIFILLSIIFFTISGAGIYFLSNQTISTRIQTNLEVDKNNTQKLIANSDLAYKLSENQIIYVHINSEVNEYKIKKIKFTEMNKFEIDIESFKSSTPLLPNSLIAVSLELDFKKIYELFVK